MARIRSRSPRSSSRSRPGLRAADIAADDGTTTRTLVDDQESPLAWLHRRRNQKGETLVSTEEFAAGERLRRDHSRGGLTATLASNWRGEALPGRSGGGGMQDLTDSALAARRRVEMALAAVGPEFAGVLLDVCCFLKGLETVEMERRWPARSTKVVLQLALRALARHYGPDAAQGPERSAQRHWGATGYRPGRLVPDDAQEPG